MDSKRDRPSPALWPQYQSQTLFYGNRTQPDVRRLRVAAAFRAESDLAAIGRDAAALPPSRPPLREDTCVSRCPRPEPLFLPPPLFLVDGRPRAPLGLAFGHATMAIAFLDMLRLAPLLVRVFGFIASRHFNLPVHAFSSLRTYGLCSGSRARDIVSDSAIWMVGRFRKSGFAAWPDSTPSDLETSEEYDPGTETCRRRMR